MQDITCYKMGNTYLLCRKLLCAKINQNSTAAYAVACLNIIENITNKPGTLQIKIEIIGSLQQHPRLRLAAITAYSKLCNYSIRMMGTIIYTIQLHSQLGKLTPKMVMHAL